MGYYHAVPCKSAKARDQMLAFMARHFRHASELFPGVPLDHRMDPPTHGKDVCAYAKANELGWYQQAGWSIEHRAYASSLLRWMALKIGRTMTTEEEQIPDQPPLTVSYTVYDGVPQPIILRSLCPDVPDGWDAEGYEVCDDLGWDRSMRGPTPDEDPEWHAKMLPWMLDLRRRKAKADPIIRAELERLEALWNSR